MSAMKAVIDVRGGGIQYVALTADETASYDAQQQAAATLAAARAAAETQRKADLLLVADAAKAPAERLAAIARLLGA